MMIAIESEGLFRTFMEFIFVLFLRGCSTSQDIFMLSYFDKLLRCCRQCLGRRLHWRCALSEGAVDYVNKGLQKKDGVIYHFIQ